MYEVLQSILGRLDPFQALTVLCLSIASGWLAKENLVLQRQIRGLQKELLSTVAAHHAEMLKAEQANNDELREQERAFSQAVIAIGQRHHDNLVALVKWLKSLR